MTLSVKTPSLQSIYFDAHNERLWNDRLDSENLVFTLHLYRRLRCRFLRGLTTAQERELIERIEPWARGQQEGGAIRYRRFKCTLAASLVVHTHGFQVVHAVSLVDISATGARVQPLELEPESRAHLLVPQQILSENVLEWPCRIAWARSGHVGMRFSSSDEHAVHEQSHLSLR